MGLDDSRLGESVRALLREARQLADSLRHGEWCDQHVVAALLRDHCDLLRAAGVDVEQLQARVGGELDRLETVPGKYSPLASRRPAPRIDHILDGAAAYASIGGYEAVTVPHVLLALMEQGAPAAHLLVECGASASRVEALARLDTEAPAAVAIHPVLAAFGQDLVELAHRGLLDPVVGRDAEINRVLQVLNRRTKSNPVLIGDPGVGKTAIVEGIAQRIASGAVPVRFRGLRVVALNVAALLANSGNRGEFEGRLHSLLEGLRQANRSVVLFVDEAHLLVGAGASEGGLDAASILKPALARGEFAFIGATTGDAYRRFIEPDAALERRLTPVWVREPTAAETLAILRQLQPRLESHHRARIDEGALRSAVELSARYLPARRLPDKAIDVVDEAASRAALEVPSERPWQIAEVTGDGVALVIEEMTGVPVSRIREREADRLQHLEERLRAQVIGQDAAVRAVAQAVIRGRLGFADAARPVASLLFQGPAGVGKSELARALATEIFGDPGALLRFDMSEYAERHTVSRLLGAPPGYVGYDDATSLTETVRRRPYQVILFDAIDRAHEDTRNVVLQVLDAGRLSDGRGRIITFKNSIVILTLSTFDEGPGGAGPASPAELRERLDAVITFAPLSPEARRAIVRRHVDRVGETLQQRGIALRLSPSMEAHLSQLAFGEDAEARALRRVVDEYVVAPITRCMLEHRPGAGTTLRLGLRDGAVVCSYQARPDPAIAGGAPPVQSTVAAENGREAAVPPPPVVPAMPSASPEPAERELVEPATLI